MLRRLSSTAANSVATLSCCCTSASMVAATGPTRSPPTVGSTVQLRSFNSNGRMTNEYYFGNKLAEIPVLNGTTKPLTRDGEWTCAFALSESMKKIVPKILHKYGFAQCEIDREMAELFPSGICSGASWTTVEDFQKTPWFRRFRPNVGHSTYCSYECMKLLEHELVPPSMRNDPYSSLRKRHMEDQFMNVKSSEIHARSIRRSDIAKQTKGLPEYGKGGISRKSYMSFCEEFGKARGGQMSNPNDSYHAWVTSVTKDGNFIGRN